MKNILLKTPLFNFSKMIPHLIEHSVLYRLDNNWNSDFFLNWIDARSYNWYTIFSFPDWYDKYIVIDKITSHLSKKVINWQKNILKDELKYPSLKQKIYQKNWKLFYNNKFNNCFRENVKLEDILYYHETYYKKVNFLDIEDFKYKNKKKINLEFEIIKYKNFQINYKSIISYGFYKNIENIWILSCLKQLIKEYCIYIQNYKYNIYFTNEIVEICFFENSIVISLWKSDLEILDNLLNSKFLLNYLKDLKKDIESFYDSKYYKKETFYIWNEERTVIDYWYLLWKESKIELLKYIKVILKNIIIYNYTLV